MNSAIRMAERIGLVNDTARLNTLVSSSVISGYYLIDEDSFLGKIDLIAKNRAAETKRLKEIFTQNTIYRYLRLNDGSEVIIYGSISYTQWRKGITGLFVSLLLLMIALNLLFFGLTHIFLIKPIAELAHTANLISAGDYEKEFEATGSSEVKMLAKSIKGMTSTIRKDIEILNIVINNMKIGFILFDATGDVFLSNREAQKSFGLNKGDDISVKIPVLKKEIEGLSHKLYTASRMITNEGTPVYVDIAVYKLKSEDSEHYIAVFRESETIPSKSDKDLNTFMNSLASMMAHEIKNPLNVISMILRMSEKKFGSDEMFHDIGIEVKKLTEITDIFADIMRSKPVTIKLGEALRPLFDKWKRLFREKKADFEWDIDESASILFDRRKLEMIFTNLLKNSYEKGKGAKVSVNAGRHGDKVFIEIYDKGEQVGKDTLFRLFNGVFSSKGSERGWGLPLVRMFLNASGGNMEIEPGDGTGTRIRLVFDYDEDLNS